MGGDDFVFEAIGVTKRFGAVAALEGVDLRVGRGELLAIVGDNGAGKSTLIKAITGAMKRDSGNLRFEGKDIEIRTPADAKQLGIETVYQDLALVSSLSVTKNIFLGRELVGTSVLSRLLGILDFKRMDIEVRSLFTRLGIQIQDLHREVSAFSGGQRQAVSISKTVMFGKRVVILDEPTAALGVRETSKAMELITSLRDHGLSVIMITHNMQHVLNYCDRVMVMRLGKLVVTRPVDGLSGDDLIGLITGAKSVDEAA